MLLDQDAQSSFSGVQLPQPGVLAPQLLGFFLDLLDFDLDHAHGSPVESRAQEARCV